MGYNLAILGCGTMGTAVLNATLEALKNGAAGDVPSSISVSVHSEKSKKRLEEAYQTQISVVLGSVENNTRLVSEADVVVVGCKPFVATDLLGPIDNKVFTGKTVVSLLAGTTISTLQDLTGAQVIARAMTNTPARLGAGMTVVSTESTTQDPVSQVTSDRIAWLFANTGKCLFMDEKYQDAATGLCGSGPAFVFLFLESLIDGAVKKGMPYAYAHECATQVVLGAAKMVQESGLHPAQLKSQVCTPGGTTIGGLMVMEEKGVRYGVAKAVEEAGDIATRLGKK